MKRASYHNFVGKKACSCKSFFHLQVWVFWRKTVFVRDVTICCSPNGQIRIRTASSVLHSLPETQKHKLHMIVSTDKKLTRGLRTFSDVPFEFSFSWTFRLKVQVSGFETWAAAHRYARNRHSTKKQAKLAIKKFGRTYFRKGWSPPSSEKRVVGKK